MVDTLYEMCNAYNTPDRIRKTTHLIYEFAYKFYPLAKVSCISKLNFGRIDIGVNGSKACWVHFYVD